MCENIENHRKIMVCLVCGDTSAEIEASLERLTFGQIKKLMQTCQCNLENLTETICRAKGIKYVR
jgi:hypothetical protein